MTLDKHSSTSIARKGARPYRGNSAEDRRLERRTKLLDAATRIFGERGYHSSTVRAICEEAGLTERYFYESFANTEALFIAMHKKTSDRIIASLSKAFRSAQDNADDRIYAMLDAYYSGVISDPISTRLFAIDAGFISPTAREVCSIWRHSFAQLLTDALGDAAAENSALTKRGIVLALLGVAMEWLESGFDRPKSAVIEAGMTITSALRSKN